MSGKNQINGEIYKRMKMRQEMQQKNPLNHWDAITCFNTIIALLIVQKIGLYRQPVRRHLNNGNLKA